MKNKIATTILLLFSLNSFGQALKEMSPKLGHLIDMSAEGELQFKKHQEDCEAVWEKISEEGGPEKLSAAEQKLYESCSETEEGYWDIIGGGCSWYCGGGPDSVSASSERKPTKDINYTGPNAHDLNYKTAWVEGIPGYGVGEYLLYHFRPGSPRITEIIVVNGYVKSEKAWRENSRVKKLKLYLNNKPYAILNLKDSREEQTFSFEPLGDRRDKNGKLLESRPPKVMWTMKFEIIEVYKGEKYDETALTEIYFDGIDVHCFAAGTLVTMANQTQKRIELIKAGDSVLTFDFQTKQLAKTQVTQLVTTKHSNLFKLTFEDRELIVTDDHPFYVEHKQWASLNPDKSNHAYMQEQPVDQLQTGDKLFVPAESAYLKLKSIEKMSGEQITFTLELNSGDSFIANGFLVKTEVLNENFTSSSSSLK